jgi:transposase
VRITTVLARVLALKQTRMRRVELHEDGLIIDVAPSTRVPRCSGCFKPVHAVHDRYDGRKWRHLDIAGMRMWLRYSIRRVRCPRCGVTVELVPWAAPQSWFTYEFEDQVAYLAQRTDKTTLSAMMRIAWATVVPSRSVLGDSSRPVICRSRRGTGLESKAERVRAVASEEPGARRVDKSAPVGVGEVA